MRSHSWFVALAALVTTSYAWPELPHFELQQVDHANAASTQRSVQGTCKRIAALTNLSNMAANQTNLDAMLASQKLTQDEIDYIKTKIDAINSELQKLNSNTTLAAECGVANAHRKAAQDCKKLDKLEKLVELANNKTAYDEHLAGEVLNQKQTEQLKQNMEDAELKLQALRSNSTLVNMCTNEVGLRQNGAVGQQAGDIGEAAVDNSGVISLSTSDATTFWSGPRLPPCIVALGLCIAFVFF
ncbi:uncharacterized protein EKO05_0003337 [Ascochyta rabiei]|uniref:uncharacterized protein n=1 Tax=Didymella rabiei TaxID=5454 RepID=UPI001902B093|nr:uncharacterized protein EKO05_0003337 [Ascochyta rabiei]UPX12800.1 hypothetical protein EKO05_0003337 [Ascochyta rabiei]